MFEDLSDDAKRAVAAFARGLLCYVEDGSVCEVRSVGFVEELQAAAALSPDKDEEEEA